MLAFAKFSLILIAMFLIPLENYAQECANSGLSNQSASNDCKKISLDPENLASLPVKVVKVNFHWVTNQQDQNFTPDGSNNTINGNDIAQEWVNLCNGDLANIPANPLYPDPNKNFVGNSRIRYEIYTDPNNAADKNGGIWYWRKDFKDGDINSYPYKDNVLNIVMHDNGPDNANGQAFIGASRIYLFNVQKELYAQTNNKFFFTKVINHELGHMCNLEQHSFQDGPCNGIDLDQDLECNIQPSGFCNNWDSGSNNMMGYNNTARALSPCQWQIFYGFLISSPEKWIKSTSCEDLSEVPDIVIDGNNETIWDKVKFVNANITVKTGSQLTLYCKLFLGPNKRIIVERGAKLVANAATISSICEEPWDGIYVYGNINKAQPDYLTNYFNLIPDEAGVVYISKSTVENANVAFTTSAPGTQFTPASINQPSYSPYWGGLIVVEETLLKNNKKVAAFMQYPRQYNALLKNKSLFIRNRFTITNDNIIDPVGVTIWDSHGITFKKNTFEKGFRFHIFGIDCSINVDGSSGHNKFYDASLASIQMEATSQSAIGIESKINNNDFYGESRAIPYAIRTFSDDNYPYALNILTNTFNDKIRYGIKISNATPLRITGNVFNQTSSTAFGMDLSNTSNNSEFESIINCNTFNTVQIGIQLRNDNKGVYFPGNTFNNGGRDISIYSTNGASVLAQVAPTQSWAQLDSKAIIEVKDFPSSNAFKSTAARIIAKKDVAKFTYFTPPVAKKTMFAEYFPDNTGQSFALSEFDKDPVTNCAKVNITPTSPPNNLPPPCTNEHVLTVREQLYQIKQQINPNESDSPLFFERDMLQTDLRENIRCISRSYLDEGRLVEAEQFLLQQPEPFYKRIVFSIRIKRGDYDAARETLNSLPIESEEDELFKRVQEINLKRYTSENQYVLSGGEEEFLTNIANSSSGNSGYARALLDLLIGYREYNNDDDDNAGYRSLSDYTKDKIKVNNRKETVFVSPNPVEDDVIFIYTKDTKVIKGRVQLINLLGRVAFDKSFSANPFERTPMDIPYLEPGLYAVRVTDGDLVLYESKISILK